MILDPEAPKVTANLRKRFWLATTSRARAPWSGKLLRRHTRKQDKRIKCVSGHTLDLLPTRRRFDDLGHFFASGRNRFCSVQPSALRTLDDDRFCRTTQTPRPW